MATDALLRSQRFWLYVLLSAIGVVYVVCATGLYVRNALLVIHIIDHSFFLRLLLGPFWFGLELVPITIALALLRIKPGLAALIIFFYQLLTSFGTFAFEPGNLGEFMAIAIFFGWNFALQVLIWILTRLIMNSLSSRAS